ncbi:MAG: class C beta-lactamase-related serine hydrolase [Ignavibacteriales bacterium]|nr:MAG: class C beta-lactamase-related serine hydrolase [Ignavibacteriales bacterium]
MVMNIRQLTNVFLFVFSFLFFPCMEDEPFKLEYQGFAPKQINDGWLLSTPEKENVNREQLENVFNIVYKEDRFKLIRSVIIVRNGEIIAESYPHDPNDIYKIQNIKSAAKSFTSICTGIALQNKYLESTSQKFSDIFPEYFTKYPDKKEITIKNALTMQTGLYYTDEDHNYDFYFSDNIVDYILSSPLNGPPGNIFFYSDDNPTLISYAIQRKFGKSLGEFANEFLFVPLGITDWKWETSKDGVSFGGTNLYLKPRDMAKFGQMLLQNGKWNGQQIVDSLWIAEATKAQYSETYWAYGYLFWILKDLKAYDAAGHGGQEIIVVPSKNLVVVVTAWPYITDTEWLRDNFTGTLLKNIISACY